MTGTVRRTSRLIPLVYLINKLEKLDNKKCLR